MSKNNIKKQHSAQALGEDSLENVSGGFSVITMPISNSPIGLRLSDAEKECLNKDLSWMKNLPNASTQEVYQQAKIKAQIACLKRHGFKEG